MTIGYSMYLVRLKYHTSELNVSLPNENAADIYTKIPTESREIIE